MGVDDAHHVGPLAINPQVKARSRVGQGHAVKGAQVVIDQNQVGLRGFVCANTELECPVGAGPVGARRDLAGQPALPVPLGTQHAAGQNQALFRGPLFQPHLARNLAIHDLAG